MAEQNSKKNDKVLEKKFQNKVIKFLNTLNFSWHYKTNDMYSVGIPDIIMCINGRFVAWENKRNGEKATAIQLIRGRKITKAKGIFRVVSEENFEEMKNELMELSEGLCL